MGWAPGMHYRHARCSMGMLAVMFAGPCFTLHMFIHEDSGPIGRLLTGKIRDSGKKSGEWSTESRQEALFLWSRASFYLYLSFICFWLSALLSFCPSLFCAPVSLLVKHWWGKWNRWSQKRWKWVETGHKQGQKSPLKVHKMCEIKNEKGGAPMYLC